MGLFDDLLDEEYIQPDALKEERQDNDSQQLYLKADNPDQQPDVDSMTRKLIEGKRTSLYFSAGNDFSDIARLGNSDTKEVDAMETVDLIVHVDYNPKWINLDEGSQSEEWCLPYTISNKASFTIEKTPFWQYRVKKAFVDFPEDANTEARGSIFTVELKYGERIYKKEVIYFELENHNVLELLMQYKISIYSFIKVREGRAWGGCAKPVTTTLLHHLKQLNTQFLIMDNSEEANEMPCEINWNRNVDGYEQNFTLTMVHDLGAWSMYEASAFKIKYGEGKMDKEDFIARLRQINEQI